MMKIMSRTKPNNVNPALALLALVATVFVACGEVSEDTTKETLTKDQARELAQKSDTMTDFCALYDWYGDGICDGFCPEPDPDCQMACSDEDCGIRPLSLPLCEDDSAGDFICEPGDDGTCGWTSTCPQPPTCSEEDCGIRPLSLPICEDDSAGYFICEPGDDGTCGWTSTCPQPPTCTDDICGIRPLAAPMCDSGETGQYECRASNGTCGYDLVCPCAEVDCGPAPGAPDQTCPDGNVVGPRCVSIEGAACDWEITQCN